MTCIGTINLCGQTSRSSSSTATTENTTSNGNSTESPTKMARPTNPPETSDQSTQAQQKVLLPQTVSFIKPRNRRKRFKRQSSDHPNKATTLESEGCIEACLIENIDVRDFQTELDRREAPARLERQLQQTVLQGEKDPADGSEDVQRRYEARTEEQDTPSEACIVLKAPPQRVRK